MNPMYLHIERAFERLTSIATRILGNPITFILAFILVIYWWTTYLGTGDVHQDIGDIIFGTTFLSLFLIQKSFNKYSALFHLKINELIASHENANNAVMDTSGKTENEIRKLSKEYIELDEDEKDIIEDVLNENKE